MVVYIAFYSNTTATMTVRTLVDFNRFPAPTAQTKENPFQVQFSEILPSTSNRAPMNMRHSAVITNTGASSLLTNIVPNVTELPSVSTRQDWYSQEDEHVGTAPGNTQYVPSEISPIPLIWV